YPITPEAPRSTSTSSGTVSRRYRPARRRGLGARARADRQPARFLLAWTLLAVRRDALRGGAAAAGVSGRRRGGGDGGPPPRREDAGLLRLYQEMRPAVLAKAVFG